MFDPETVAQLPAEFDLAAATRAAVEKTVSLLVKPDETWAFVASLEVDGLKPKAQIVGAVRVGDHFELRGKGAIDFARHFSGSLELVAHG